MATLSVTAAWDETTQFLKRESRLVLPIAFLLVSLPGALMQYALPIAEPGRPVDVEALMADLRVFAMAALAAGVVGMIGNIAINYLAIRPGASVGEALQRGLRRFLILFVAGLLVALAAAAACLPLFLLVPGQAFGSEAALGGAFLFALLVYLILCVMVGVRLLMITAIAAAEDVGPVGIIRRSWQLTQGHFWKLLGFLILFLVVSMVVMIAIGAILGIVVILALGPSLPGSPTAFVMLLISACVQAVLAALFGTMSGRIYAQLAGVGDAKPA